MYTKEISILKGLKNGYQVFRDFDHPLAYPSDGCVYLHRHVASIKYGRWVKSSEVVHHKDHNKLNNDENNLEILSNEEHGRLHGSGSTEEITYYCSNCGTEFLPIKSSKKLFCSLTCSHSSTIKNKALTKELLDELIPKHSWIVLGSMFGYSDNGIKKRAKALGCTLPIRAKRKT